MSQLTVWLLFFHSWTSGCMLETAGLKLLIEAGCECPLEAERTKLSSYWDEPHPRESDALKSRLYTTDVVNFHAYWITEEEKNKA